MTEPVSPTAYPAVNAGLRDFLASVRAILGPQLRGMYLVGSLAVGDFDPTTSDLDIIVVTDGALSDDRVAALRDFHTRLGAGDSPFARRLEAAYIPERDLRRPASATSSYPPVERDRPFFVEPLEPGWSVQRYTLCEHGIVVAGPDPRDLLDPVDPDELCDQMRRDGATIAHTWLDQAEHDPTWLDWARQRPYFAFVVATLCRLLYTLESGGVASKPAAIGWARQALDGQWAGFIARSWAARNEDGDAPQNEMDTLVAFIRYTAERYDPFEARAGR
jgi:predicted nucleotidyltransferase